MTTEDYAATSDQQRARAAQGDSDAEHVSLSPQSSVLSPPAPTYWPVVMAGGIVFMTWGVATTLAITAVGLALFALALGGWIGDWRHGH